jgi:hypothetical protein
MARQHLIQPGPLARPVRMKEVSRAQEAWVRNNSGHPLWLGWRAVRCPAPVPIQAGWAWVWRHGGLLAFGRTLGECAARR